MPVCDKCQTSYDDWQHFCLHCGQHLKTELPFPRRCPQCNAQLGLDQNFCQECAAPVKNAPSGPSRLISRWKWLTMSLTLMLVILGASLIVYFIQGPTPAPAPPGDLADRPAGEVPGQPPASKPPAASVQAEVIKVFEQIREANLGKDIVLYMNALSAVYPELDKKRREITQTWEKFDYNDMDFTVKGIQELNKDTALVDVTWTTSALQRATRQLRQDEYHYRVWFARELGQWRITKIEEVRP